MRKVIVLCLVALAGLFTAHTVFATNNGGANGSADISTCSDNGDGTFSSRRVLLDDLVVGGYSSGDIVPPFNYYDSSGVISYFSGVGWSGNNLGLYNNGCLDQSTSSSSSNNTYSTTDEDNEYSTTNETTTPEETTSTTTESPCTAEHPCPNPPCEEGGVFHGNDCFTPTVTVTVPGPTTTVTQTVRVGGGTNTVTVTLPAVTLPQATTTVQLPGPTVTVVKKTVKPCKKVKKPKKTAHTP